MTEQEGRGWCCWANWHTKKAVLGNNKDEDDIELKECVYIFVCQCQGTVLPLTIVTVCMNEMPTCVSVCMRSCHVSE